MKRLIPAFRNNKKLVSNFGYLSALRLVTLLVPILTIPYLLKILGRETYGLVVFAQSIVSYFLIIINFGFDVSAARLISVYRDNKNRTSDIVSNVLFIKASFFLLSLCILVLFLSFSSYSVRDKWLFVFTMMYMPLYDVIFPQWYFLGKERMKNIAIINSLSKGVFVCLIFFLIKTKTDYVKVPIINGIGSLISGTIALFIVFFIDKVKFKWPKPATLIYYFRDSSPIFLGNIAGKIKVISNKAILGVFVDLDSVAIYDIAEKVNSLMISFLEIIGRVLFPNVAKNKNSRLVRNMLKIQFGLGLLAYVLISVIGWILVPLFAPSYYLSVQVFYVIGLTILIQPISYTIGTSVLIVNDLVKGYAKSLYISLLAYVSSLLLFLILGEINIYNISLSLLIAVFVELSYRIYISSKTGLKNWML